jgi:hypothetical protein
LPLALTDVRDASMTWVAAALTAGTLAWTAGGIQDGATRAARRRLLERTACLFAGAAGATAVLSPMLPAAASSVLAWAVAGLGIGIAYPVGDARDPRNRAGRPRGRGLRHHADRQRARDRARHGAPGGELSRASRRAVARRRSASDSCDAASLVACALALVAARCGGAEATRPPPLNIALLRERPGSSPAGPRIRPDSRSFVTSAGRRPNAVRPTRPPPSITSAAGSGTVPR